MVKHGGIVKGQRKIIIVPDEPGAEPREYSLPRGIHVNLQEGERSVPASRCSMVRAIRTTS